MVLRLLGRLHAEAEAEDPIAKRRVRAGEAELGERLTQAQRYELYGNAPLAIDREAGDLLYTLCLARGARTVLEFGSSWGISTIYLAAALRDGGEGGSMITTELLAEKAEAAQRNLKEAGLAEMVELRAGDALETLRKTPEEIDLIFLDGRNDLYLPVLQLIEPRLAPGALVAADLNSEDPDLLPYLEYVRDPNGGYASTEIALGEGVEVSVRTS